LAQAPKVAPDHAAQMAKGRELFTRHVRPVLTQHCLKCHGGDKTRGDLDLTTRESLLRDTGEGPVVVPGKARDSRLYKLITHQQEPHMPAQGPRLGDAQIAHIAAWIDAGAPYDRPLLEKAAGAAKKPMTVTDADRRFWSFQPLHRPAVPAVKDSAWCRTPIDRFILARLEAKGLAPNPAVDRRRLIRRAYFDLIGLPPTPQEVEAFVNDPAADAYEKLLDRLLENPHHGERWARHWLDIARFAESHGFEHDTDRPHAFHYRDFVIKALNQDLPYDTFVKWQLAGDEYEPGNPLALMATGFLAAGTHSTQITKNLVEKERYEELDDMARTTGTAMLGLTVGCARCHDHKYDPIPTRDYYRLISTFTTTVRSDYEIKLDPEGYRWAKATFDAEHAKLVEELKHHEVQGPWFRISDPLWQQLRRRVDEHLKAAPRPTTKVLICSEGVPPLRLHTQGADFFEQTYFLKRGDPDQKDGVVTQGFLQVLMRSPEQEKHWQVAPPRGWRTSYRRRALAEWITDVDHGAGHLLARVIVNRLWQHHLGRGLVATASAFGAQGEPPTHPELLDWLATRLIDNGWRLRPIHKLIMSSAVYRQSAAHDTHRTAVDPDNRLLSRYPTRRLEAEVIRDAMLAVSGTLDARMFGPGTLDPNHKRRSIYFFVKRSKLIPTMVLFDAPDALQGIDRRPTTTVAPQALLLMNSAAVRDYAEHFARRVSPTEATALPDAVRAGYLIALGRPPGVAELTDSVRFVQEQAEAYRADRREHARLTALADFCQVLLGLNEFIYVE
jgi:mono/diheme cytochrome c family protein